MKQVKNFFIDHSQGKWDGLGAVHQIPRKMSMPEAISSSASLSSTSHFPVSGCCAETRKAPQQRLLPLYWEAACMAQLGMSPCIAPGCGPEAEGTWPGVSLRSRNRVHSVIAAATQDLWNRMCQGTSQFPAPQQ